MAAKPKPAPKPARAGRRPAPVPSTRPAAPRPAPAPVSPLDQAVNAAIGAQVAGITTQAGQVAGQQQANIRQSGQLAQGTINELNLLRQRAGMTTGDLMNLAAARQANAANAQAANLPMLQQMLSGGNPLGEGGQQGIQSAVQTQASGDLMNNTKLAGSLALESAGQQDWLNRSLGVTAMAHQQYATDQMRSAATQLQGLLGQAAAAKAQAPLLRRQFSQEDLQSSLATRKQNLDESVATKQFGLQQQQFGAQQSQQDFARQEQLKSDKLARDTLNAKTGATANKAQSAAAAQARYDKFGAPVSQIIASSRQGTPELDPTTGKPTGKIVPGTIKPLDNWHDFVGNLVSHQVPRDVAIHYANNEFPDYAGNAASGGWFSYWSYLKDLGYDPQAAANKASKKYPKALQQMQQAGYKIDLRTGKVTQPKPAKVYVPPGTHIVQSSRGPTAIADV